MQPVTKSEFDALITPLGPFPPDCVETPVMVAVSGGADSMALAFLAGSWRKHVVALVVDHGLRAESACEADQTCARLEALGITSHLLTLADLPPGSMQEEARDARFQRLEHACVESGSSILLMAHHAADQEETLMMRYERSSRVSGMCGIASRAMRERIAVVRPLLSIRPERLRATLRMAGVNWSEDPSNQKRQYRRVQVRQDMTCPQREEMMMRCREACSEQEAIEHGVSMWMAEHVVWHSEGWVTLALEAWSSCSSSRVLYDGLTRLIKLIGGKLYGPSLSSVQRLCRHRVGSLGGVCMAYRPAYGDYIMMREARGVMPAVQARHGVRWDGRWRYMGPDLPGHMIGALGRHTSSLRAGRDVPAMVLQTVPVMWCDDEVVAVPEDVRGVQTELPRFSLVWESGVPVTGERSFG